MKPRIVLATDSLDPSGVGQHMLTLASELAADFDVVLACPECSGALLSQAAVQGCGVLRLDLSDLAGFERWLRWANPDLLHVHAGIGWEGIELCWAGRRAGVPVVRTEHLPYLLTEPGQQRVYAEALESIDALVCVSRAAAETYAAAGVDPDRLRVVPNGIRPQEPSRDRTAVRKELGIGEHTPLLLCIARFTPQKGHADLVEAFASVACQTDAHLLLVGTGPEQDAVQQAAAGRGIADKVSFLGVRRDVPDLLGAADLLVLPSHFEGLPLVVLEAMAAGLPVVATMIGGTYEALGEDHAFLVPDGAPAELARVLLTALADPDAARRDGLVEKARFEAHFRAERMGRDTRAVFEEVGLTSKARASAAARTTRLGFIGAGGIAHRHLGVLRDFDDVALCAFADPDSERAEAAAGQFGARAYGDYAQMLEQEDLDAVYICVPPFAHGGPEDAVIARGLPFFVEKPLCLDIELARRIGAAVEAAGLVTAVGYHWRYLDTTEEAQRLVARNPAQLLSGYWLGSTPPPHWWWRQDQSGGQMVEQTTHIIDLARLLAGDVVEVFGLAGHTQRPEFPDLDVPTVSSASLRFASGAIGTISSTCLLGWTHRVGLHLFAPGLAIELGDREIMVDVGQGRPVRAAEGDPVWREDRDFIDAIRGGENRVRCSYAEALKTHRIAIAIARSAETGQPVSLHKL